MFEQGECTGFWSFLTTPSPGSMHGGLLERANNISMANTYLLQPFSPCCVHEVLSASMLSCKRLQYFSAPEEGKSDEHLRGDGCREGGDMGEPEYGTLTWATLAALKLAANKVLMQADRKKLFLQTLVLLITGNAAKHTDPAILMGILTIVRSWLLNPQPHSAAPNKPPELVSLTEKVRAQPLWRPQPCLLH